MEFISPLLRTDFREFCVNHLVLRSIDDIFTMAAIKRSKVPQDRHLSGQRRIRVEEYYASLNWHSKTDAEKFLKVLSYALAKQYGSDEPRKLLLSLFKRESLIVDGIFVSLKESKPSVSYPLVNATALAELKEKLLTLQSLQAQPRGFELERFLKQLFDVHGLKPRSSFRLIGEQIDGSFELDSHTYLLEAKWKQEPSGQSDLLIFREKVENKSTWTRGLFLSISGFTKEGIIAYSRGRATNIIGMDGQDLFFIVSGEISLIDAISRKARRAAETGEFYVSVFELLRS